MLKQLVKELHETLMHVLPLCLLIVALCGLLPLLGGEAMPREMFERFVLGAVFLLVGMALIELGAKLSLVPMGEKIGAYLSRTGKYTLLMIFCLLMGVLVTLAEPDIAIFASQYPGVADRHIIFTIAAGVGVFLTLGILRVIRRIPLHLTLACFYAAVFVIAEFAPDSFLGVAFDAGGVATGPILVPFIMAVGIGLATVRGGRASGDDVFGTVAVCAIGPVCAMLLLGLFGGGEGIDAHSHGAASSGSALMQLVRALPVFLEEVALALLPIMVFFAVCVLAFLRLPKKSLIRTGVGLAYSFVGHTVFLTGVSVGFLPAGEFLGGAIASLPNGLELLIIPIGMLMGCFVVMAEPAVQVMNANVESVTVGAISKRAMMTTFAIGAAFSVGVAMLRVLTGMHLRWFLIGGYAAAIGLSFIVPKRISAIAFDSGGVASGSLALIFLLPFARGADVVLTGGEQNLLTDAFGLMALVAMTPLIAIQVLGLIYTMKLRRASYSERAADDTVTIISFETEEL